ncbi:hypothetical protein BJ508DRAFT_301984 [Ascobolus immersus RN42]|uniref:Uncharacterized protein n=1 Tax=Ascobolus immersus RN42 TaxID=1160509 RepID=A0A3N4IKF8_ASCIM|nr:hypothetical protein BJ508DRAFT_301984 [Ascobolus immersus RN42]
MADSKDCARLPFCFVCCEHCWNSRFQDDEFPHMLSPPLTKSDPSIRLQHGTKLAELHHRHRSVQPVPPAGCPSPYPDLALFNPILNRLLDFVSRISKYDIVHVETKCLRQDGTRKGIKLYFVSLVDDPSSTFKTSSRQLQQLQRKKEIIRIEFSMSQTHTHTILTVVHEEPIQGTGT